MHTLAGLLPCANLGVGYLPHPSASVSKWALHEVCFGSKSQLVCWCFFPIWLSRVTSSSSWPPPPVTTTSTATTARAGLFAFGDLAAILLLLIEYHYYIPTYLPNYYYQYLLPTTTYYHLYSLPTTFYLLPITYNHYPECYYYHYVFFFSYFCLYYNYYPCLVLSCSSLQVGISRSKAIWCFHFPYHGRC